MSIEAVAYMLLRVSPTVSTVALKGLLEDRDDQYEHTKGS